MVETKQGSAIPVPQQPVGYESTVSIVAPNPWDNELLGCFDGEDELCIKTCCCPCFTYGKTAHRLKEPSMATYSSCNLDCCLFAGATYCNLHWLLVFLQRTEVRDTFSLKGNSLVDLILGCYCPCCALIQQAKEVETKQRLAGYSAQGYRAPQGMAMTPQAQGVTLTRQV